MAPTSDKKLRSRVAVMIGLNTRSRDQGGSCCRDWYQRPIKSPCRALLPGDAPGLLSTARIDSKIGAGVGSGGGHQLRQVCLTSRKRLINGWPMTFVLAK